MEVLIQQVGCFQHCRPGHWEAAPGAPCPEKAVLFGVNALG